MLGRLCLESTAKINYAFSRLVLCMYLLLLCASSTYVCSTVQFVGEWKTVDNVRVRTVVRMGNELNTYKTCSSSVGELELGIVTYQLSESPAIRSLGHSRDALLFHKKRVRQ